MVERPLDPRTLPCLGWLNRIAETTGGFAQPLAELLQHSASRFHWGQTYRSTDFGEAFLDNYGWLEVFGARGHFKHDTIAAGLLLLGPDTIYPDHHHLAEEIYLPLTGGTEWRMGGEPFRHRGAGDAIHHRSNVPHAMRTGEEPLLALYLWRGGPLDQHSVIDAKGA